MISNWSFIQRKFKSVPYPIAAQNCVSGVKSCIRNSQIPYLKANPYLKKSFVSLMDMEFRVEYGIREIDRHKISLMSTFGLDIE